MTNQRFKVVDGSQSCHCCFEFTVVDTTKPVMIGGIHYREQFEAICECFERGYADMIAAGLNHMAEPINHAQQESADGQKEPEELPRFNNFASAVQKVSGVEVMAADDGQLYRIDANHGTITKMRWAP